MGNMDSAEKHVKSLLANISEFESSKSKLYRKSRDRLKSISDICLQVVSIISGVLQEESLTLNPTDVEFGGASAQQMLPMIDHMQEQLDTLRKFAGLPNADQVSMLSTSEFSASQIPNQKQRKLSSKEKKDALHSYLTVTNTLSHVDFKYDAVNRCAKFLYNWLNVRFSKTSAGTGFRYNIRKFPAWFRDIVLIYGKAMHDNTYMALDQRLNFWITSVLDNPENNNMYALPFEVYQFGKSISASDMSLEAVVTWDILYNNGLSELCTSDRSDLYPCEDSVYQICSDLCPEILNKYTNYVYDPKVLLTLGWEVRKDA